jgi:hypothetical protein
MATLIREAYNDPGVCHDFGCRAWVKLVHPFNPHDFIHCLMAQFYANSHSPIHKDQEIIISKEKEDEEIIGVQVLQCMEAPEYNLLGEFVQKMKKKYLVILEDLPTMVVWDAIRALLPDWKNGSRIIVSTHQMEIAELCVGHPYQVAELIKFSVHHSVYAYSKLVSLTRSSSSNTQRISGFFYSFSTKIAPLSIYSYNMSLSFFSRFLYKGILPLTNSPSLLISLATYT